VTLSLKNLLGCIPNAGGTHGGGCPRIADISALDPIKKKTRLIVVDSVRGQYDRGPGFSPSFVWNYGGLIVGTDTVAVDAVGVNEILSKRKAMGVQWPTSIKSKWSVCRAHRIRKTQNSDRINRIDRIILFISLSCVMFPLPAVSAMG
jgi:uncharacterized protein (DUF362 family)